MEWVWAGLAALVVVLGIWALRLPITVLEYEQGLQYTHGRFEKLLAPGKYWYRPSRTTIRTVDVRVRFVTLPGQEVMSAEGLTLKVSLAASFAIPRPDLATNLVQDFREALYLELQLALREIVGAMTIDALLTSRAELSRQLLEAVAPKAAAIGLELRLVSLKDMMFPGKLRETFAQVVNARQEGLAALERARGETAALRHLANTAQLLDAHPSLLQLRLIQEVRQTSGNTLVLGLAPSGLPAAPPPPPPRPVSGGGAGPSGKVGGEAGLAPER